MHCRGVLTAVLATAFLGGCATAIGSVANPGEAVFADDAAAQARDYALANVPSGASHSWRNPQTGAEGNLIVVATYRGPDQRICRELKEEAVLANGRGVELRSVYCLVPGTGWTLAATG